MTHSLKQSNALFLNDFIYLFICNCRLNASTFELHSTVCANTSKWHFMQIQYLREMISYVRRVFVPDEVPLMLTQKYKIEERVQPEHNLGHLASTGTPFPPAWTKCYCRFGAGLNGEPCKNRFAFPQAREPPQSKVLHHWIHVSFPGSAKHKHTRLARDAPAHDTKASRERLENRQSFKLLNCSCCTSTPHADQA